MRAGRLDEPCFGHSPHAQAPLTVFSCGPPPPLARARASRTRGMTRGSRAGTISRADKTYIVQAYSAAEIGTFTQDRRFIFFSISIPIWARTDSTPSYLYAVRYRRRAAAVAWRRRRRDGSGKHLGSGGAEGRGDGGMMAIECLARRPYLVARRSLDVLPRTPTPELHPLRTDEQERRSWRGACVYGERPFPVLGGAFGREESTKAVLATGNGYGVEYRRGGWCRGARVACVGKRRRRRGGGGGARDGSVACGWCCGEGLGGFQVVARIARAAIMPQIVPVSGTLLLIGPHRIALRGRRCGGGAISDARYARLGTAAAEDRRSMTCRRYAQGSSAKIDGSKRPRTMLAMWVCSAGRQSQVVHAGRRRFSSTQNGCGESSAEKGNDAAEGMRTAGEVRAPRIIKILQYDSQTRPGSMGLRTEASTNEEKRLYAKSASRPRYGGKGFNDWGKRRRERRADGCVERDAWVAKDATESARRRGLFDQPSTRRTGEEAALEAWRDGCPARI
ncbi:hypothetical protein B0H19DRAFT_1279736 [Mycena capillaripes]|nr:hypothetical protein B0H19DRAFT_1279736 [Mycena capillaripes]